MGKTSYGLNKTLGGPRRRSVFSFWTRERSVASVDFQTSNPPSSNLGTIYEGGTESHEQQFFVK